MQNFRFVYAAVLSVLFGLAFPVFADDAAELTRDRQRIAQALKDKNFQRAARLAEPWLKKHPDDIELANDYAQSMAQMGKLDRAREVLEEALIKNPRTSAAFINLREILGQQAAISYAKAMGKKPPPVQVALKSNVPVELPVATAASAATAAPASPAKIEPPSEPASEATPPTKVAAVATKPEPTKTVEPKVADKTEPKATEKIEPKTAEKIPAKSKPAKSAAAETAASDESALVAATQQWADAWAAKDFERYLAAYSEKFQPKQFASRDEWIANRRPRVTRPDPMLIKVSEIKVRALPNNEAEVRFRQRYEAGSLKLNSSKVTIWIKETDGWKILREEGR